MPRRREGALGVAQMHVLALVERGIARSGQSGARSGDQIAAQFSDAIAGLC